MRDRLHCSAGLPCALTFASVLAAWQPCAAQFQERDAVSLHTIGGFENGDFWGYLVLPLGDVDNDNVPDFASGAPFADTGGGSSGGWISVHSGASGSLIWFDYTGITSAILGFSMEAFRDVDGDGAMDFLAAAPFNGASGGIVRLYSGRTGAILQPFNGPANSNFGTSISASGDFNGDGVKDILIGAGGDDTFGNNAGALYVYSGVSTGPNAFALITTIPPPDEGFGFGPIGDVVEFIGDLSVPSDGRAEFAAGRRYASNFAPGKIYVMSWNGTSASIVYSINDISLSGSLDSDRLTSGRDLNGDGVNDLMLGQIDSATCVATIFSGTNGSVLKSFPGITGTAFGSGRMIPDIDADGVPDVAIGARRDDTAADNGGRVFLYSGASGGLLRTMTCTLAGTFFGSDIDVIGDVNGDGRKDFVVGSCGSINGGPGRVDIMAGVGPPCQGDAVPGGGVNVNDLLAVIGAWGRCADCAACPADVAPFPAHDCVVNVTDLLMVIGHWGPCP